MRFLFVIFGAPILLATTCMEITGIDIYHYEVPCDTKIPSFREDQNWIFTKDVESNFKCKDFQNFSLMQKKQNSASRQFEGEFAARIDTKKCEILIAHERHCSIGSVEKNCENNSSYYLGGNSKILSLIQKMELGIVQESKVVDFIEKEKLKEFCE